MNIEKLIEHLRTKSLYKDKATLEIMDLCMDAATALSALRVENKRLKSLLGEGGQDLWSKENQRADRLEAELEIERTKHQLGRCLCCAGTQPLTFENMQYCPNCGALMDEGEENG